MSFSSLIERQNVDQLSIDDYIDLSKKNASEEWLAAALDEFRTVCLVQERLNSDDVRNRLEAKGLIPKSWSSLGAVAKEAVDKGWCEFICTEPSRRPSSHRRPIRVWKSLLFSPLSF